MRKFEPTTYDKHTELIRKTRAYGNKLIKHKCAKLYFETQI